MESLNRLTAYSVPSHNRYETKIKYKSKTNTRLLNKKYRVRFKTKRSRLDVPIILAGWEELDPVEYTVYMR